MKFRCDVGFLLLALAALLAVAKPVSACVCPDTDDTVVGKFEFACSQSVN